MNDIRDNSLHLVAILADMVRSALAWEDDHCNAVTRAESDDRRVDCIPETYTLSPHRDTPQPQKASEEGDYDNHE